MKHEECGMNWLHFALLVLMTKSRGRFVSLVGDSRKIKEHFIALWVAVILTTAAHQIEPTRASGNDW